MTVVEAQADGLIGLDSRAAPYASVFRFCAVKHIWRLFGTSIQHASQIAVVYPNRGDRQRASVQNAQVPVPL